MRSSSSSRAFRLPARIFNLAISSLDGSSMKLAGTTVWPGYSVYCKVCGVFDRACGFTDATGSFGLTGYDAVSHMVEEMPNPHLNAPKTMVAAVLIGAGSSFVFLICLLFCMQDIDLVNSSSAGALLESMYQATNSRAGAICLQVFPIVAMAFTAQAIMTASSRMSYAFARDRGLPVGLSIQRFTQSKSDARQFSRFFAVMHKSGVPVPAVLLSTVCVIVFGLIYLGSDTALNAILSSSVVFLNISYSIPSESYSIVQASSELTRAVLLVVIRGRKILRPPSLPEPTLTLGPILGPICNIVCPSSA